MAEDELMGRGKTWSADELNYLRENWGNMSLHTIAQKLGRSDNAVKLKVVRNGMGAFLDNGLYITFNQLANAIGISYKKKDQLIKNGFPIKYRRVCKSRFAIVYIEDFWKWAEQHKELIDFSKMPLNTLGKEPAWVKEARTANFQGQHKCSPWTAAEDARLVQMLKCYKYYIDDIAVALNRTEGAVKRRMLDLKISYRPLKHPTKPWTEAEIIKLLEMRSAGHGWGSIGKELGRSSVSCSGKFDNLANPYYTKRSTRNSKAALSDCFQRSMCEHWHRASGCDVNGTNCDSCEYFCRKSPSDDLNTGWKSTKQCVLAAELLKQMKKEV